MAGTQPLRICPRCGGVIQAIYEKKGPNGKTYYYAYHKGGRQCYLGPSVYTYVTKTHEDLRLTLYGAVEPERLVEYLERLVEAVDLEAMKEEHVRRIIRAMAKLMRRWQVHQQRQKRQRRQA